MRQDKARIKRATDVSLSTSIDKHRQASIDNKAKSTTWYRPVIEVGWYKKIFLDIWSKKFEDWSSKYQNWSKR
ncbi:hypothetical protein YC2023_117222 [Brassica napus]